MRLLHVVPTYLPAVRYGGPIRTVHGLCRALVARGHDVHIFTTDIDGPDRSPVPVGVPVSIDGVAVTYFASRVLRRLSYAPAMARALARETQRFDIVHGHSVFLWPTWMASRAAMRAGRPYVLSPRGALVRDLIRRRNRAVKTAWIELIERRNLQRAAAICLTSAREAEEIETFGWRLPPLHVVPNGVDAIGDEQCAEAGADVTKLARSKSLILFLGRLSWVKGLDILVKAVSLMETGELAIVGPDDEGVMPSLRALAQDQGVAERVHFLPRAVDAREKMELFGAARALVLPSYSENFGNVVLEAMQHGVPVVVTPSVGAADAVRRADAGLVVEGSPVAVAGAIQRLFADPERARSMGERGRAFALAHYTWDKVAAQMEGLYERLLAAPR